MTFSKRHVFAALLIALPLGCRGIIGVEDRQFAEQVSCEHYCDLVDFLCVDDEHKQYQKDACLSLCPAFPKGALGDGEATLACRVEAIEDALATTELGSCSQAGPTAGGACGTRCQAYCATLESICPAEFAGFGGKCEEECAKIPDCGDYTADPDRNDDTLQCRFYHLVSASIAPEIHCPHAVGIHHCDEPAPTTGCVNNP